MDVATDGPLAVQLTHAVPAHLAPYVDSVVAYDYRMQAPGLHAGLPSPHLTVIVSLDEPVDMIAMPDRRQAPTALATLVGGMHAAPVTIRHDGTQIGLHLSITPLGCRALFGMPPSELAWRVVPLDLALGGAGDVVDRLRSLESWPERFAVLDELLGRAVREVRRPAAPEVSYAFARLVAGERRVAALAGEVGWSRRHLTGQFVREFGLAPKVLARVVRFHGAASRLRSPSPPALAVVAVEAGYADQAHMTREWVELAGSSPAAWMVEEGFPIVQDEVTGGVAH